jgi:hypothetical protein
MIDVARITGNLTGLALFDCLRAFFNRRRDPIEIVIASAKKGERPFRLRVVLYPPDPAASSRL